MQFIHCILIINTFTFPLIPRAVALPYGEHRATAASLAHESHPGTLALALRPHPRHGKITAPKGADAVFRHEVDGT